MDIRKCYPGGKERAFNLTYDDGVRQDIGMVELLNELGLKGTFNLNSQLMETGYTWQHESGMTVRRLTPHEAAGLYEGHEVASHTLTHPYLAELPREEVLRQMGEDKRKLEELFGREVRGFALPFYGWTETLRACALECGFSYARISEESRGYTPPKDHFSWRAGLFHLDAGLERFVEDFFRSDEELALCQIVGHSYDLDVTGGWENMARLLRMVSVDENTISMTNGELADYLSAMEQAVISDSCIENLSCQTLWFRVNGETVKVDAGERYQV